MWNSRLRLGGLRIDRLVARRRSVGRLRLCRCRGHGGLTVARLVVLRLVHRSLRVCGLGCNYTGRVCWARNVCRPRWLIWVAVGLSRVDVRLAGIAIRLPLPAAVKTALTICWLGVARLVVTALIALWPLLVATISAPGIPLRTCGIRRQSPGRGLRCPDSGAWCFHWTYRHGSLVDLLAHAVVHAEALPLVDLAAGGEVSLGDCGCADGAVLEVLVAVVALVHVDRAVVVVVTNLGHVAVVNIRDVDSVYVGWAGSVPRPVRLTRP